MKVCKKHQIRSVNGEPYPAIDPHHELALRGALGRSQLISEATASAMLAASAPPSTARMQELEEVINEQTR